MKITKKETLELLRSMRRIQVQTYGPEVGIVAALDAAIRAVERQPNYKRLGARGGQATARAYGSKRMREWGKMGGRPRKTPGG